MTGGNNSTTSGGASQGSRAVEAALSAKAPFRPRAGDSAMRIGTRHAERWAPEGRSAKQPRSLGALAFADTTLSPYVESANRFARSNMFGVTPSAFGGVVEREVEATSWVFPRPWYMDELAWLAAARATSSGYHPSMGASPAMRGTARHAPIGATQVGTSLPLELIAPSYHMGASRSSELFTASATSASKSPRSYGRISGSMPDDSLRGVRTGRPSSLRTWSPLVSFPAAQAAEIMQAVASSSAAAERSSSTMADEAWALFEYVAPSDVTQRDSDMHVAEGARRRMERAVARAARRREALAVRPDTSTVSVSEMRPQATSGSVVSPSPVQANSPAGAPGGPTAEPTRAPSATSAAELLRRSIAAGGAAIEPAAGPRVALPSGLGGAVVGLHAARSLNKPLVARAARASAPLFTDLVMPRLTAGGATGGARILDAAAGMDIRPSTPGADKGDVLASTTPPASMMPFPGSRTQRSATERPVTGVSDYRPATSAYRAVASQRPRGMQHLAWSDRWLARFAGASHSSLSRFDASTGHASLDVLSDEVMARNAPTPVFISGDISSRTAHVEGASRSTYESTSSLVPTAPHVVVPVSMRPVIGGATSNTAARSAPSTAPARAQSRQSDPKTSALVIGDDESVSDEVFAAIAAAALPPSADARRLAARSRDRQQVLERERARQIGAAARAQRRPEVGEGVDQGPAAAGKRTAVSRSVVDRLLDFGPVAPGPGMRSALAASPIASALNAIVPMPATRSFDVRSVSGDSLAYAYLIGAVEPEMRFVGSAERAAMVGALFTSSDGQDSLISSLSADTPSRQAVLEKLARSAPESAFVAPLDPASAFMEQSSARDTRDPAHGASLPPSAAVTFRSEAVQDHAHARTTESTPSGDIPAGRTDMSPASTSRPVVLDVVSPLLPTAEIRALQFSSLSPLSRTAPVAAAATSALTAPNWGMSTTEALTSLAGGAGYAYGPGQAGTRAQAWSVEQERASADLAFDFVTPELIAAARIYGFGPAEASQASRLSVAGRAGLTSLASAVDLTFIDTFEGAHNQQASSRSGAFVRVGEGTPRYASSVSGMRPDSAASPKSSDIRSPEVSSTSIGSVVAVPPVGAVISQPERVRAATEPAKSSLITDAASAFAQSTGAGPVSRGRFDSSRGRAPLGLSVTDSAATAGLQRTTFGGSGRRPRGAFLWPKAAISALGLDGFETGDETPVTLAALDLLAARAVANVGIFVAPDGTPMSFAATNDAVMSPSDGRRVQQATSATSGVYTNVVTDGMDRPLVAPDSVPRASSEIPVEAPTTQSWSPASSGQAAASPAGASTSYSERARVAVAGIGIPVNSPEEAVAIVSTVGSSQVPREFRALYVALSRSPAGRSMSPAVRAARALALSQSIDAGTSSSARARAAAAWAVMPMVIPSVELSHGTTSLDAGDVVSGASRNMQFAPRSRGTAGAIRPDEYRTDAGEGTVYLAGGDWAAGDRAAAPSSAVTGSGDPRVQESRIAASRAGESLRSLVAPYSEYQQPNTSERSAARGAVMRAPTAAPPLVQTGGSAASIAPERAAMQQMISAARSKRASGDVSIPSWFEKAARRMFEDSPDGGISLAEMTLVATAPVSQVAASPRTASASPAAAPTNAGGTENEGAQAAPDVEAMALEVYTEIIRLMEVSRERNGEPWR